MQNGDKGEEAKTLQERLALFLKGDEYAAYQIFGAHFCTVKGGTGGCFRVFAPKATAVSVVGNFNGWVVGANPMAPIAPGVYEAFVPGLLTFAEYKYAVAVPGGKTTLKTDPYAAHTETRPGQAAKVFDISRYSWQDVEYKKAQQQVNPFERPMNIYELHAGSWRRYEDGNFYNYQELARQLVPYLQEMGYTHIEFMPLTEYPFDGSWGYQVTGYFAPTARYGTPEDFMAMVDAFHSAGIGVLLDFVPAHFPKDEFGLAEFDGTPLYEDGNPKRGRHEEWGTLVFDFGKPCVQSFLISSALYWLKEMHIDGLRVDAVASMLYLDYGRKEGEWQKNTGGGRENLEAVAFLKKLNAAVRTQCPGAITIAEESTAWPGVTAPLEDGGLGFHFKWNMGWMNDILSYIGTDPFFKKGVHEKLTFSFHYAYSERYILPLSHDEVVHGKLSLINKQPGSYEEKFAGLKVLYSFMAAHPGKKLLFMGGEFGQFIEWNEAQELDWLLLSYETHREMKNFTAKLNNFYKNTPALWQQDYMQGGCLPLVMDDDSQNIIAFLRIAKNGAGILAVCNFAPVARGMYKIGVPAMGGYRQCFTTGEQAKSGAAAQQTATALKGKMHGQAQYISVDIPGLTALFFETPPL